MIKEGKVDVPRILAESSLNRKKAKKVKREVENTGEDTEQIIVNI